MAKKQHIIQAFEEQMKILELLDKGPLSYTNIDKNSSLNLHTGSLSNRLNKLLDYNFILKRNDKYYKNKGKLKMTKGMKEKITDYVRYDQQASSIINNYLKEKREKKESEWLKELEEKSPDLFNSWSKRLKK